MRVKLSLMGDMCMPQPGLLSFHESLPCVEMPTPIMWAPGFALQQNQLTKTVFHRSQSMALEGHDCGHMIPHIWFPPIPPPPILLKLPVIIALSKRKVAFSASKVKAEDSQIACAQLFGGLPLPMLTCGSPVSLPNSYPVFNFLHNVSVGLTAGDLLAGIIGIALTMVCDGLCRMPHLSKGIKGPFKELVGAANFEQFCLKTAFGILIGGARLAGTQETELKIQAFSAYAGFGTSIEAKKDGRLGFSAQAQIFTGVGSVQEKGSTTFANGGNTIDERSSVSASLFGERSTTTTETRDSKGRLVTRTTQTWGMSL